jgi:hypothetical protein
MLDRLRRVCDWLYGRTYNSAIHNVCLTSSAPIQQARDIWKYSQEHVDVMTPWGTPWGALFAYTTFNPSLHLIVFVSAFMRRFEAWIWRAFPKKQYVCRIECVDSDKVCTVLYVHGGPWSRHL